MKKTLLLRLFFLLSVTSAMSQAPQSIPYQAVARSVSGELLSNKNISMRFSIRNSTAAGSILYRETQAVTTNTLGLFTSNIGQGTVVSGSFTGIDWANGNKFLQVEMDTSGGSTFTDMGTQQLLSVPYALHATGSGDWTRNGTNLYNNNSGAVGLGTSTPSALSKLDINGKIRITDGTQGAGKVLGSDANGLASWITPSSGTVTSVSATSPLSSSGGSTPNINLGTAGVTNGGTGITSYTAGDILYANGTSSLFKLNMGASGNALLSGAGAPAWGKIGLSTHVSGVLPVASGGTGTTTSPLAGQLLIGTGAGYLTSNLSAGPGISITNGAGTITINNTSALTGGSTNSLAKWTSGSTLAPSSIYDDGSNIGLGINSPADKLHVIGNIRMVDGNQGINKVMVSDANGKATWTTLSTSLTNGWGTTGNSGTSSATNFIGTTDNQPLMFKVASQKAGQIGLLSGNTGFGYGTLSSITTGEQNLSLGYNSLSLTTSGSINVAVGVNALRQNVSGNFNIAIGQSSLFNNVAGSGAIAIGSSAMANANNSSSAFNSSNIAIGNEALKGSLTLANNTGNNNVAIGASSMSVNTSGENNAAIGGYALINNASGSNNTAIGNSSMQNNTSGWSNTAVGIVALIANTTGNSNTAIGHNALYSNVAGGRGTAIGGYAMMYANNTTSPFTNENIAIGYESLRGSFDPSLNTGNTNISIGYQAMHNNSSGSANIAIGKYSMGNNSTGSDNVAVGLTSLSANTTGIRNTALGYSALYFSKAGNNATAIGYGAMYYANNTTTSYNNNNVAVGYEALRGGITPSANTGTGNTAMGFIASRNNTSGSSNTAVGTNTLQNNESGSSNTALGFNSMYTNTGSFNTAVGAMSSNGIYTGDQLTSIGYSAGPSTDGLTNATAIGANAMVSLSNSLVLGNNANVGIGCNAPQYKLHVVGDIAAQGGTLRATSAVINTSIVSCSDIRYKKEVSPLRNSLRNIMNLEGVTYYWKTNEFPEKHFSEQKQIGLIAQELEKIYPELVDTDAKGYKSVDYTKLTPILLEAIKELKLENDRLKNENTAIRNDVEKIKSHLGLDMKAER